MALHCDKTLEKGSCSLLGLRPPIQSGSIFFGTTTLQSLFQSAITDLLAKHIRQYAMVCALHFKSRVLVECFYNSEQL
jgi:hypothetical protein